MTTIYTETAAYAKSVGELDLYRVSLHENKNCKNAIDKAISENFDGFRLKKDCYKPVIEQFGQERMLYVLANTLQLRGSTMQPTQAKQKTANSSPLMPAIRILPTRSLLYRAVNIRPTPGERKSMRLSPIRCASPSSRARLHPKTQIKSDMSLHPAF